MWASPQRLGVVLLALVGAFAGPTARKRVLVCTLSAGYVHDVVKREKPDEPSIVERALVDLGKRTGAFEAVLTRDPADFTAANLAKFDLVFFYTTGELPFSKEQRDALLEFVRKGGAFAGAHCATDTWYSSPEYGEMIGAWFDGHPWHEKVRIRVEDRAHPATKHLGESFEIEDEIYQFKAPYDRSKLHVLLSLDTSSVDLSRDGIHRADRDFATAWCKEFGKGRVFYTALGHGPETWKDERFLAHLAGGFRWAMRMPEPAPAAPSSPAVEEYRAFALENRGDPAHGFKVFRESSQGAMCVRCHTVFGVGAQVGPDLSDVAKKYDRAEIVSSILEPSKRIAEGYRSSSIELDTGVVLFGMVRNETAAALDLYDTNGDRRTIEKSEIESRRELDTSVMPDGLALTLSKEDFADLVGYLATLRGAPGGK